MTGTAVKDSARGANSTREASTITDETLTLHPDAVIYGAVCCSCDWKTRGHDDARLVLDECLKHSVRSGHKSFRHFSEGLAFVLSADERVGE
ncbi:hypothetical protein ACPCTO_24865 [Streptomyces olivoreticuli]